MKEIKETMRYLLRKDDRIGASRRWVTQFYASLIMIATALVMTIQNIRNETFYMAMATGVMAAVLSINLIVTKKLKNIALSSTVIATLMIAILSGFVVGGGNRGFACLWTLLVPSVSLMVLGVLPGVLLSVYFLVFIFILFYSPLRVVIEDKYTFTFIQRFPVLYLCTTGLSLYTSLQREYYMRKIREKSFFDELTGAYNRNFFLEQIEHAEVLGSPDLAVIMIDLNGLKTANDTLGHAGGDELLIGLVEVCRSVFGEEAGPFRMGGDEFAMLIDAPISTLEAQIARLCSVRDNWKGRLNEKMHFAVGRASKAEFPTLTPIELMKVADERMYADKKEFYTRYARQRNDAPRR